MELSEEKDIAPAKTVPVLTGVAVLAAISVLGLYNYLVFHTVAELFSIAVAFAIFMLAWNSRRYSTDNYLQVIGISYFFVGLIDLVHTMSYKGMGVFPGYDANLPTQLWVAGRYVQSLSLLAAPFFIGRKLNYTALLSVYSMTVVLIFATAFSRVFPACYIEGAGLTPFKITSEYLISFFFVISIALLLRAKRHFEAHVVRLMAWSMAFAVGGELALTFYVDVYGISNMTGHFFKIVSFYLVYRAIVVTGLMRPYDLLFKSLKQSEASLREYKGHLEELVEGRTLELKRINEELEQEIAERKKAEKRLMAGNTLMKLLSKLSSRKEYLEAAIKLIRSWSGCRCVGIRIFDEYGRIPYETYLGFSREFWESESMLSLELDQCICTRIMAGKTEPQDASALTPFGSFQCNNTFEFIAGLSPQEQARFRGTCIRSGFASVAVIPVRHGGKIVAAVHLADEREGMVSREFIEFFESMTPLIGEAIHKLDTEAEHARLIAAIESTADAIAVTDTGRIIRYVNHAFQVVTGYSADEVIGKNLDILRSERHDEAFYQKIWSAPEHGSAWNGRVTSRRKDGTLYEEDITISPVKGTSGELINYVVVKRDVTEKLRLEAIAEAVNTMNNIGYFVSGIRHELGNPVNSAKMALSMLKVNLGNYSLTAIKDYLERSLAELSRVEYLLRGLKNFNMYENPELQFFALQNFMDKLYALIRGDFSKKQIPVEVSVAPEVGDCYADPRALQQVMLNILANAADACAGRESPKVAITIKKASGIIVIQVEDNGHGMTEEQQRDLFKPFRTTKPQGTGLGLVIARKMMIKMNGDIKVKSRPDEGTTVSIYVPEKP